MSVPAMRCRPMWRSAVSRLLTLVLADARQLAGLATLLTPAVAAVRRLVLVTVVLSFDPSTSIRRLSLDRLRDRCHRGDAAVGEIAERTDALAQHFSIGRAGHFLSRNCVRAAPVYPSGFRSAGTRTCRKLARVVRPQEFGGRHHGDVVVPWHLRHPLRRLAVRYCRHWPVVVVPGVFGGEKLADAVLCSPAADLADGRRSFLLGCAR